jgi:hypothetical protein
VRVVARRGFLAVVERLAGERLVLALADFVREAEGFLAALVLRAGLLRTAGLPALLRVADFARGDALRVVVERRAPLLRAEELELPPEFSSAAHLPDITRCAASATASAISEPSLVALAIMLLAACDAVSAASSPASRIARRAFGLALIAAAAAASPAASISLLIAAFASLSTVSEEEPEEPLRADLAITSSPCVGEKTL